MEYEIKYDGKIVYKDSLFYNAKKGDKFLTLDNHIVTYSSYQNGVHSLSMTIIVVKNQYHIIMMERHIFPHINFR